MPDAKYFPKAGPRQSKAISALAALASARAMARVRARVRELTPRSRCHEDLRSVIADLNRVLRGWGAYFRTGNAAIKFVQIDRYVVERSRALLIQRHGARLRPGRVEAWHRPFFEALGLYRLNGTIQYPGAAQCHI